MNKKSAQRKPFVMVKDILLATHLLPSVLVTTMTAALAYGSGQRGSLLLLIPAVLFGQFCIGWTNDYLDRHRDKVAGRIKKPIVSGAARAGTIRTLALVAFAAAILFSFAYDVTATWVYVVALGSALLYDFRLKNSILSPLSYVVSFGLLPVYVGLGAEQPFLANGWIILALALWGVGVHIQNVIPDFEHDAKTGIKGAAHYFTRFGAMVLTGAMLTLSVASLCVTYAIAGATYRWLVVGVFVMVALIFVAMIVAKNIPNAYKISMVMTAIVSILIMLSGPYL